jgi:hypothetical protein
LNRDFTLLYILLLYFCSVFLYELTVHTYIQHSRIPRVHDCQI